VQQRAQQFAQHHQQHGYYRRRGQHPALHLAFGGLVEGRGHFQERDQRQLRPDAYQQYQKRVDRTGRGDRGLVHLPSLPKRAFLAPRPAGVVPLSGTT
jgi:hypothetical protein